MQEINEDSIKILKTVKATPYVVDTSKSIVDLGKHVAESNNDFKENIIRKVQTIKLKDTADLNKKVEELKKQEASELAQLNKGYTELDIRCKKLERKVSYYLFIYLYSLERSIHWSHWILD